VAACLWGIALCAPSVARAADIAWDGPGECQRADVAAAQVEKLVGQRLSSIDWISFEVEISITEGAHLVVLRTLAQGSAPREREITGASCTEVTDAVSVAIALTISEREREQHAASAESDPPREADDQAPVPSTTVDEADGALRFALGAGVLVDAGALPNAVPGIDLGGALEWKALRIGAFLAVFVPQDEQLPNEVYGGTFDFVLAGFDVCAKPELDALHLLACAGFELGRIGARGDNKVVNAREGDAGWYAPRTELGVGYGFAEIVRVWLRGGIAVPLARPEFLLDGEDRVHKPSSLSLRGLVALEIVL
jgi:hypothetical protein